ncbi:c-type cytochrome biogenesis protein CcsB [Geoalkalibacter halelectricus]|uniref:c-type cytochrome biogenesis protein CcsB n=1 Tax=Geoalkalibacter halelectricus TaxID=2847045 RepID=UPI003D1B20A0
MSVNILLFKLALMVYLGATILYLCDIIFRRFDVGRFARWVLIGGFLAHTGVLVVRFIEAGHTPVTNLHESLSFSAWTLVGTFLLFDTRYRLPVLGAFITPLAVILMFFGGATFTRVAEIDPVLQSWWFPVHVVLAFLGNAMFTMAFAVSVMYLLQERMLKNKKLSGLFYRLPSLSTLDGINYKCLTFGFPLMTMGIISGAVWANSAWGGYWRWDPKETWSLIVWFIYAALLHGRLTAGWRGRRAAIFSIIGFLCLLFSYLGVSYLLPTEHRFK